MEKTVAAVAAEKNDHGTILQRHPGVLDARAEVQNALDTLTEKLSGLDESWQEVQDARAKFREAVRGSGLRISIEKAEAHDIAIKEI